MLAQLRRLNPPARVGYSLNLVVRGASVVAAGTGLIAFGFAVVTVVTRVAPMLLWGRTEDAAAVVAAQLHGVAFVAAKVQAVAVGVLAFLGIA